MASRQGIEPQITDLETVVLPLHHREANLAEEVRFELTVPFDTTVFKTAALNHSATLPNFGAALRDRTPDLRFTRALLYQLS